MATVPLTFTQVDAYTLFGTWDIMNPGDTGALLSIWAFPKLTFQLTGSVPGGDRSKPNIPVMADRSVALYGSLDGSCFAPLHTLIVIDPAGMNARLGDVAVDASAWTRFRYIMPICNGSLNPLGADCAVQFLAYRLFAKRTA